MDNMAGKVYLNPVTQERAVVLVSGADSGGELVRAELWAPPGARVAAPHIHPHQTERFEVLAGRLGVRRGSTTTVVGPGHVAEVRAGEVHDWWTEGDEPARVLVEVRPALRFEEAIVTLWGLAAAGRTDASGNPGLLQLSLLAQEWDDQIRFASPPRWVQRLMVAVVGPIARWRGLRGSYPELEERILIGRAGEVLTLTGSEPAAARS
jgi:mannose-6-phosphate isomerase-like protein (cupin superfamily)